MTDTNLLQIVRGSADSWTLTLRNAAGEPIAATGSETLAATVHAGDDQVALFAPTATWAAAASGTVTLSIAAGATSTLAAGRYVVTLTVGATKRVVGWLEVIDAAGTATPRPTYCDYDRMKRRAGSWLADMLTLSDQAGFAEYRADARAWLDEQILMMVPASRRASVRANLDGDLLTVTDRIADACAHKAVHYVAAAQIGPEGHEKWRAMAEWHGNEAERLMHGLTAEFASGAAYTYIYPRMPQRISR